MSRDDAPGSRRVCWERHPLCRSISENGFGSESGPIMRTCRTRFSALPVEDIVCELLMAHARPGLHKVYDLRAYEKEKADALKLWHANLRNRPVPSGERFPTGPKTECFPTSGKRRTRHPDSGKTWGIGRLQIDSTPSIKDSSGSIPEVPVIS